jgi:hypothetical protein
VFLQENSSFTMESGVIKDNTAAFVGGGVHMDSRTSFTMTGGVIKGNKAREGGGGVFASGIFIKKGGTIYGDTDAVHTTGADENTVTGGSAKGHAVALAWSLKRDANAGPEVNLYASASSAGWILADPAAGGVGDTTDKWQAQ